MAWLKRICGRGADPESFSFPSRPALLFEGKPCHAFPLPLDHRPRTRTASNLRAGRSSSLSSREEILWRFTSYPASNSSDFWEGLNCFTIFWLVGMSARVFALRLETLAVKYGCTSLSSYLPISSLCSFSHGSCAAHFAGTLRFARPGEPRPGAGARGYHRRGARGSRRG